MNKWLELLVGLILVIVPIVVASSTLTLWEIGWGTATLQTLMGGIILFVILIGLLFLMLGISDLKS